MRRQIRIAPFIFSIALLSVVAQAAAKHGPVSVTDQVIYGADVATHKSNHDLLRILEGLRYLIKNASTDAKREELLLNQAATALAVARNYRLYTDHKAENQTLEKRYLDLARSSSESVLQLSAPTATSKTKALYYSGLAFIYLGDQEAAQKRFLEAISTGPNLDIAPLMSLLVAEVSYDKEKYHEAIGQYKMFFTKLNDVQKTIAVYKTSWCQINLHDFDSAEKNLLRLAVNTKSGAFVEDSKKDLAFVMTQHRDENEILALQPKEFEKVPGLRAQILTNVYKIYQAQSATQRHPLLFAELMKIEPDPAKKLSLVISNIRAQQRSYASVEPYKEYLDLRSRLKELELHPESPVFLKVANELEPELKSLIRAFADTFLGQVKSPENIAGADLGADLSDMLKFHAEYFPKSPDRFTSYGIWMDVCAKTENFQCEYDVGKRVLADPGATKMARRANLVLIGGLEGLQKQNPKFRQEFVDRLTEFYTKMSTDTEWLRIAKRLSVLLEEGKAYDKAIPVLEKIDAVEKSSESRYRLYLAYFQGGIFAKLAAAEPPFAKDKFGTDTAGLVREAHLRLADEEIKKNDFSAYEKNIQGYLKSDPDAKKRELVRRDYLGRLLDRNQLEPVHSALLAMPVSQRFGDSYSSVTARLIDFHIRDGQFAEARAILSQGAGFGIYPNFEMEWYQVDTAAGLSLTPLEMRRLAKAAPADRQYILGVLALTRSADALKYFSTIDAAQSPDKAILLLAHQVEADQWDVKLDARTIHILGNTLPPELRAMGETSSEKQARLMYFPTKHGMKATQEVALKTRALRKAFIKDLDGKLPQIQLRILKSATDLEDRVAKLISDSPVPASLVEPQASEYKAGIEGLAKEFTNQAEEYRKLSASIEDKMKQGKVTQPIDLVKFHDPNTKAAPVVNTLIASRNFAGAMVALDRWKKLNSINDTDYYTLRVKILLSERNSEFMQQYVIRELESAHESELLSQWRTAK